MSMSDALQWHYLIFLLPIGVAALLLLLSSLRMGARHGGHRGHGTSPGRHMPAGRHGGASSASSHRHHGAAKPAHSGQKRTHGTQKTKASWETSPFGLVLALLGIGRLPFVLVIELFAVAWGFCGFWANQLLLKTPTPRLMEMLPSLGIAFFGGLVVSRIAAEILVRVMPKDETFVVSQDGLFGMVGRVTFPVTESEGRILLYDEFGTLHDERCCVEAGQMSIEKGRRVLVMDRDVQGRLVVEELPDSRD